jgi:hypothetical protein
METIRGKTSHELDYSGLVERIADYKHIHLDLGTGDGRYVCRRAAQYQDHFFIGLDACRENLRANSRIKLPNALFVIASAQALPEELNGLASHVTINFPWGSLLEGLLSREGSLVSQFQYITRPFAGLDIHLNAEAPVTAGWTLESGADQIERVMNAEGWRLRSRSWTDAGVLRSLPTTWAKRLAFGRDPRAIHLSLQRE